MALDIGDVDEAIYKMLRSAVFERWYNKEFDDHIAAEENCKTKEQIMQDIADLLGPISR